MATDEAPIWGHACHFDIERHELLIAAPTKLMV
jgi:hypothetical protein